MKIGYACLTVGVMNTSLRGITLKFITDDRLLEIINHNLHSLENMIEYNHQHNINIFRISSDMIPFASSEVNSLPWWDLFKERLEAIGVKAKQYQMRLTMHPGQYTVINSPNQVVVNRSIADLNYHTRFLDCLGLDSTHKVILHIGGIYNDKSAAISRFISNYHLLEDNVKRRLVIENDDKSYSIADVLEISKEVGIPVIYDNLHNKINPSDPKKDDSYWVDEVKKTWKVEDGTQKIHYSEQDEHKQIGSHSKTITVHKFLKFVDSLNRDDVDIMLEVKDKNISAAKCINALRKNKDIKYLEAEWIQYQDMILERSPLHYYQIVELMKDKTQYPAASFYHLLDDALAKEVNIAYAVHTMLKIWNEIDQYVTKKERESFFKNLIKYQNHQSSLNTVKNILYKIINHHQLDGYNTYFFTII